MSSKWACRDFDHGEKNTGPVGYTSSSPSDALGWLGIPSWGSDLSFVEPGKHKGLAGRTAEELGSGKAGVSGVGTQLVVLSDHGYPDH